MATNLLNTIIKQASTLPDAALAEVQDEAARQLQICNACRYCEGYCAVFPAMARRLEFGPADLHYLANLCHNCGACLHACQYAPPHEFAVNVPQAMAKMRVQTYATFAWPARLGKLYQRNGLTLALALAAALALFLVLMLQRTGSLWHAPLAGNFYAVFPHNLLVGMFGAVFGFAVLSLGLGALRFWKFQHPNAILTPALAKPANKPGAGFAEAAQPGQPMRPALGGALSQAAMDALTLKNLGGGHGLGCNNEDDRWTLWRRRFHHLTFYGFMLCFASTSLATLYHYLLNLKAPYPLTSLPVVLGTLGGLGLLAGPVGLAWLHLKRHPQQGDGAQRPMDLGFMALLFLTSLTGLLLMALRDTSAMALLLAVHLGVVMALFATLPYGKFAHGVYRSLALLQNAVEQKTPKRSGLAAD